LKEICILATGGTFDKEYNELNGRIRSIRQNNWSNTRRVLMPLFLAQTMSWPIWILPLMPARSTKESSFYQHVSAVLKKGFSLPMVPTG